MSKLQTLRQALETNPEVTIIDYVDYPNLDGRWNGQDVGHISGKKILGYTRDSYIEGRAHIVQYFVSPKNGLFTAEELDEFLKGLIPEGLKPNYMVTSSRPKERYGKYKNRDGHPDNWFEICDYHNDTNGGRLRFGRLYFTERVGLRRTIQKDIGNDEEFSKALGERIIIGEEPVWGRTIELGDAIDLERVISITLFPSEVVAKDILHGGGRYGGQFKQHGIPWSYLSTYAPQSSAQR
ncbi:hypothetical protein HYX07_03355 [Candidatus Woesearchaeota archaeon]|nr:hypothetical protein [Candidatus Woesearchaeota archaeon]